MYVNSCICVATKNASIRPTFVSTSGLGGYVETAFRGTLSFPGRICSLRIVLMINFLGRWLHTSLLPNQFQGDLSISSIILYLHFKSEGSHVEVLQIN